ncbi:hypothetical protein D1159_02420 [Pseudoflavonifractor sp. 524-17]|uniref:S-layer homology domain-containing protein n=1 Tax=Pseudoflavonifractor sp. 524-17 TaxID=2304577 RepID=UPI00137A6FCD|nr:S-layer homology domain-containing protein [Pseudoflavonifractor sp. 524-17]NCE63462.1 hypothetical protein [Pseudoflavonifractor sp. 524-17]
MNAKRVVSCLLLSGSLLACGSLPAAAAEYRDLPASHWACDDMQYAAWLGVIKGVGGNQMAPSAPLSRGQFLTMLARAFAPQQYQAATGQGLAWDQAALSAARSAGLIPDGMDLSDLNGSITRLEVAVLLNQVLPEEVLSRGSSWIRPAEEVLADFSLIPSEYQQAVSNLVSLHIIQGKSDGTFGGGDALQRCDGSVLLVRTIKAIDSSLYQQPAQLGLTFVDETGACVASAVVSSNVGESAYRLFSENGPEGYDFDGGYYTVSSVQNQYTIPLRTLTEAERQEALFWKRYQAGEVSYEDYYKQDFLLKAQGENPRKYMLLFGDYETRRFPNKEAAEAAMTTVTVPVWKLGKNGQKTASTMSLRIHAALAEDVKQIFTEIYNDPEQFPFADLGGYAWRGDTATGEHNCGTAIDMNANQNYQIRDGKILVGSCWEPGSNPYSIPENGSVVRIFAAHGWAWGGDAWAMDADASTGYHDYMHFSYMGM